MTEGITERGNVTLGYSYHAPLQTDDGWTTASISDVGISEEPIVRLINELSHKNDNHIEGIVIVKDSKLVFEEYFSGEDLDLSRGYSFTKREFNRDTPHCLASDSKSVTSILVGIAIDQGKIRSVNEKVYSIFPEYADPNEPEKANMTLKDMLTMTSGLPWNENSFPFSDYRNDFTKHFISADPVGLVLRTPLESSPGTKFVYNSGTTNVLGEVVRRSTGATLAEFAKKYLFEPLGITSFNWISFPFAPKIAVASSALYLRPRDMAKIGELYLQKGIWNGSRLVSEDWVRESTSGIIKVPSSENFMPDFIQSYGYQWWRGTFARGNAETYFAAGLGGQYIFILPSHNVVVVITAGSFHGESYRGIYDIVNDYILATIS